MSAALVPSDDELRAFLLGNLPADGVERVRGWLDADPAAAARLDAFAPRDPLTAALADRTPSPPVPADSVERVFRGVAETLREPAADTSELADGGGTVRSPTPPSSASTDPAPAWPPTHLGDYRVVREIGRGGMGVVLEVADDMLNRRVAAKVLNPDLTRRSDARARFLREARAAAAVAHDHVVPILHISGEAAPLPYIVMPLLKGEPLDERLKREGAQPVEEVIRIGREIAAGLAAAHACGLVHRDMKPANVWLDEGTGRARVLDFGLARLGDGTDALTEAGVLQGTPAYMAPEQIDGHPADARADLFALGAILYECATGKRAFPGTTITAILKAVATHEPAPPATVNPQITPELSALVMSLLAKAAAARPATATDVGRALAGLLPGASPGEPATVTWSAPVTRAAPHRGPALWAVGVLLAVLVGAGVWAGTRSRPPEVVKESPPAEPGPPAKSDAATAQPAPTPQAVPVRYKGKVEVLVERVENGTARTLRLNEAGALPLTKSDKFRIEGEVEPPAYLYVVWVDPARDVTPVYPWNPKTGWGSRPATEQPVGKVSLPPNVGNRYTAPESKPGVATMVLFASPTPLAVPDDAIRGWFEALPDLPLPAGGDGAAVWFDNFAETKDPLRLRTFGEVESDDPFARWQGQLQKSLGGKVSFQTAVSFARTGRK